jgi:hypothetical protein
LEEKVTDNQTPATPEQIEPVSDRVARLEAELADAREKCR